MASILCPVCAQASFTSIEALRSSLIKVANGPLLCPFCGDLLCGLDKLTIHLFSHSISSTLPSTEILNDSYEKQCLNRSLELNTDRSETVEEVLSVCDICKISFHSEDLRQIHMKVMHQCQWSPIEQEQRESWPPIGPDGTSTFHATRLSDDITAYSYKCHLCSKMFKMKGSLRVHLKVVHSVGIKISSTSMESYQENTNPDSEIEGRKGSDPLPPMEMIGTWMTNNNGFELSSNGETSKNWECDVCSKTFTTKYFLKKHKRLHTGEMPYTCELCGRTFTFQQSYHKHLLYHSDEKPHICGVCGRAFKELSTLHNHERIHSGEKPFKCEICEKSFRQRVSFLVHTRIHTGVMPYKCEYCQKRFRYKVSQRTHKCNGNGVPQLQMPTLSLSPLGVQSPSSLDAENLIKSLLDNPPVPAVDSVSVLEEQESLSSLTRSIDEFVLQSCHKLGITGDNNDSSI